MTTDVSSETMEARRRWNNAPELLKENPVNSGFYNQGQPVPFKNENIFRLRNI